MNLYPTSFSKGLGVISEEAPDAWVWRNGPAVHRFAQKTRARAEQFKPSENDVGWIIPTGDAKDCGKFYKLAGESYSLWKFEQERAMARGLSGILCVRHSMSTRSMNATQDEGRDRSGQGGAAAILSRSA